MIAKTLSTLMALIKEYATDKHPVALLVKRFKARFVLHRLLTVYEYPRCGFIASWTVCLYSVFTRALC